MNALGICGGVFALYYLIGLAFVYSKGTGPAKTGFLLALIWPLLMFGGS